ncbi:porin [Candidatus Pelagibacter bacterium]|nr:porin [Candidatus Pelagibacter bacterium]
MNKTKGEIMNNFKKIGLTALAGSLAAVSANAAEMSVSGETTVSYISNTAEKVNTVGGSSIGTSTGITFSGSGELENGWTVSSSNILNDGDANALSSSQLNLTMGSMGTITFAKLAGTNVNGIDDVTPKVAEEAWDGAGGSVLQGIGSSTNSGAVAYKSPSFDLMGVSASFGVDYDPAAGATGSDHDAVATKTATQGSGMGAVVKLSHDSGLTVGAGVEEVSSNSGNNAEAQNVTGYALYTMGPVSVGYQGYYLDTGTSAKLGATAGADYSGDAVGIAFNVNDQVSIGYQKVSEDKEARGGVVGTTRDIKSLSAAYSSGGMTMSIQQTDTDNYALAAAADALDTETVQVTLSFAF